MPRPSTRRVSAGSMMPSSHKPRRWRSRDGPGVSYCSRSGALKASSSSAVQMPPRGLDAVALDRGQHAGRLLAAHDADARVRPHPQEARAIGTAAHRVVAGAETAADDDGELRHVRAGDGGDHLRAVLGDAGLSYFLPTMKPVMFCRNTSGMLRWLQSSMKCAPFSARFGEQDAVVGDDADRIAVDMREAGDQGLAVARLELVQLAAVDDARDHFADVERTARVLSARCRTTPRRRTAVRAAAHGQRQVLAAVERADDVARDAPAHGGRSRRNGRPRRRSRCARRRRRAFRHRPLRRSPPSPAAGRRGRSCPVP